MVDDAPVPAGAGAVAVRSGPSGALDALADADGLSVILRDAENRSVRLDRVFEDAPFRVAYAFTRANSSLS